MIVPKAGFRIVMAPKPVDFSKGHDGLPAVVQNGLGRDPHSGIVVVFRPERASRVKILTWDGTGLTVACKRLEDGRFAWPAIDEGVMRLSRSRFETLFEGLSTGAGSGARGRASLLRQSGSGQAFAGGRTLTLR